MKIKNPIEKFKAEVKNNVKKMSLNKKLKQTTRDFFMESLKARYHYNFTWLGRPIIQYPSDIIGIQELIWKIKPDLIIETGVAHGGSLILSASILEMIGGKGEVIGIDIDIRKHNRREIEKHKLFKRIKLLEGSSVEPKMIQNVIKLSRGKKRILAFLDSNHSYSHVFSELQLYSPFVSKNSYIVVFDTVIENIPQENRLWGRGDSPMTAVKKFLLINKNFVVDKEYEDKMLITVAPGGFLRRIK